MKWIFGVAVIAVAGAAGYWFLTRHQTVVVDNPNPYRKIESRVELNDAQTKELVSSAGPTHLVSRAKSGAIWQVQLGEQATGDKLGKLFSVPQTPEVSAPVYLCRFEVGGKANLALDSKANCSGEGTPEGPQPAGYVSEKIRTGFLLMARCKSADAGFYNTLNLHCESPADHLQSVLGAIRAAE